MRTNSTHMGRFPSTNQSDKIADVAAGTRAHYKKLIDGAAARRRRSQMRRRRNSEEADALHQQEEEDDHVVGSGNGGQEVVPVRAGAAAVAGRQREMEDTVTVWMDLCSPLITGCIPVHYFGVYDGHGGSHFSTICKEKMHGIFKDELLLGGPATAIQIGADESLLQETWRVVISRVFARTERVALRTCTCGSEGFHCTCDRSSLNYSGTTAVAVLLTEHHIVVGNCGDSRAVLYRAGQIVPLSSDHKPERADEKARIEASGGKVVSTDTDRVQGVLAMSRAIGDVFLKPHVISEPDMTFTRRDGEDEFVILASDGMWDVIPMEMAGRVARQCLSDEAGGGGTLLPEHEPFPSPAVAAASLLTRLALARSSTDNIAVVVIDLNGEQV
ncbi:protein-serine/threonine phosphatase [Salvia divinorum]|uniref:protein-serine/threonine phosphatase n=1 Tax=Salvia divinorum TaxID=28513 RepID=A0ABD1FK87_SALDI